MNIELVKWQSFLAFQQTPCAYMIEWELFALKKKKMDTDVILGAT